jgi:hypothetical protein
MRVAAWVALLIAHAGAQVIEFESNGLKYQTLTRRGVTVMFARLPSHVREYAIIQVAVSNGSGSPYTIRPEDFRFTYEDGNSFRAAPARTVVAELLEKGSRGDVVKLVSNYESALYGMRNMRSTNGFESRRRAAFAEVNSTKLKAAAAASAVALVQSRLAPGETTDGAVFFPTEGKALSGARLVVSTNTDLFEFRGE